MNYSFIGIPEEIYNSDTNSEELYVGYFEKGKLVHIYYDLNGKYLDCDLQIIK